MSQRFGTLSPSLVPGHKVRSYKKHRWDAHSSLQMCRGCCMIWENAWKMWNATNWLSRKGNPWIHIFVSLCFIEVESAELYNLLRGVPIRVKETKTDASCWSISEEINVQCGRLMNHPWARRRNPTQFFVTHWGYSVYWVSHELSPTFQHQMSSLFLFKFTLTFPGDWVCVIDVDKLCFFWIIEGVSCQMWQIPEPNMEV